MLTPCFVLYFAVVELGHLNAGLNRAPDIVKLRRALHVLQLGLRDGKCDTLLMNLACWLAISFTALTTI